MRLPFDPALAAWAAHADGAAKAAEAAAPADMIRCDGTWYVGVNALPNDGAGRLPGGPPLPDALGDVARAVGGRAFQMDRAQASVCHTGYPRKGAEEEAAYGYRLRRDAAHVDGLLPIGPDRRRKLMERHALILGLPLNEAPEGAAPFVIWEGSHEVMREAFRAAFADAPPSTWAERDVTEVYHAARRRCFETLARVEIAAKPGEAYIAHRLSLHGVAPWGEAAPGRRAVAYFRPDPGGHDDDWWLSAP